ncbi:MAG: FHA domain-containing protein [Deltaproteobacteria bacterium]|nr:FHA domain-containing protein [Deltaproteobacteria bacterium]
MPLGLVVQVVRGGQVVAEHPFDLTKKVVKIGRSPTAQIRVEDPAASRVHAVLEIGPTGIALVDLGTSVGTLLNGARVSRAPVNSGDQIIIGETLLAITIGETYGAGAPAASPASYYQAAGSPPPRPSAGPPSMPARPMVPGQPFARPTRPPSPFAPPPGPPTMPPVAPVFPVFTAPPPSSSYAMPPGLPPSGAPTGATDPDDTLSDNDPLLQRARAASRKRTYLVLGGVGLGVLVIVATVLQSSNREPRYPDLRPSEADGAAPGDSSALGDGGAPGDGGGDTGVGDARSGGDGVAAAAAIEAEPAAAAPFDAKEPRDEDGYLYVRLTAAKTLEAVTTEHYGSTRRLALVTGANPGVKAATDSLAAGSEVRLPRHAEYVVRRGDSLGTIAAAELGGEASEARLLAANKDVLGDPDALAVGMTLKIPLLATEP